MIKKCKKHCFVKKQIHAIPLSYKGIFLGERIVKNIFKCKHCGLTKDNYLKEKKEKNEAQTPSGNFC